MCGVIGYSGLNDPSSLKEGLNTISHRGPDDEGTFFDPENGIGLGHRRLSIIDLSPTGHQPMVSEDGNIVIVFNGEIYNFIELRKQLIDKGYSFRGSSDTEVLLNLYLEEGSKMLNKLNGIFSFAIWDARKKEIFLARDALGVKPLYYSSINGKFFFASEIKAIQKMVPDHAEIDEKAVDRHLTYIWCPGERTILKSVKKVLPGNAIQIVSGRIKRKWSWYELPITQDFGTHLSLSDSIIGTEEKLRQAVHRQMISDVPLGAFLSGGLDSSSVAVFAKEKNPDIRCFTIKSDVSKKDGQVDDLPYAKKVAKHLEIPLDTVEISSELMAHDLERMVLQLDEPLADPACLNVLYISELARESGIKVLLSGAGGDDIFTGYRRHYALQLQRFWKWLPKSLLNVLEKSTTGLNTNIAFQRRLRKYFNGINLEKDDRIVNYFRWTDEETIRRIYSEDFLSSLGNSNNSKPILEFLGPMSEKKSDLDRMLAIEQRFFLADHNLLYTDKMTMAAGVEARVPFLDTGLVEFSAKIPNKFKQRGSEGKWVLKKAMEPYLPKEIIYRSKTGFGAPLRHWMQNDLQELLSDLLSSESIRKRGIFSEKSVQDLLSSNKSGFVDASHTLLSILCIEIWCREHIDL